MVTGHSVQGGEGPQRIGEVLRIQLVDSWFYSSSNQRDMSHIYVTHRNVSCQVTYEQMVTGHTVESGKGPQGVGDVLRIEIVD